MGSIIEITDLNKTFGNKKALDQVNLTINHNEMTALLGPSGSGKSTLLRHLSGLIISDKDASGEIKVLGKTVQRAGKPAKDVRACRSQAGYIFQQFNLVNRLSVMTNVLIGSLSETPFWRSMTGNFTKDQKARAMSALDRVGMAEFASQRVSNLSGGQQQRVAIARALMQNARIIFADEPIASLDPESSRIVMELLQDINQKEGIPVVVTLHQVEHALRYCKHIVALRDGKVFFEGRSKGVSEAEINALYRGKAAPKKAEMPAGETAPAFNEPLTLTH